LLKYATIVCERFHWTDPDHCPIIAEFAAHGTQAKKSDIGGFHQFAVLSLSTAFIK
jgi:hypothetical protein